MIVASRHFAADVYEQCVLVDSKQRTAGRLNTDSSGQRLSVDIYSRFQSGC